MIWKPGSLFIFYESYRGYEKDKFTEAFADQVKRVRYDYNKLACESVPG